VFVDPVRRAVDTGRREIHDPARTKRPQEGDQVRRAGEGGDRVQDRRALRQERRQIGQARARLQIESQAARSWNFASPAIGHHDIGARLRQPPGDPPRREPRAEN
jgi:hypothetical protein